MNWLFGMGGKLAAIGAALLAGLAIVWRILAQQKKAGIDQQKVKEGEARDKVLKKVRDANDAAARVHPDDGGVQSDPFNRDNWKR